MAVISPVVPSRRRVRIVSGVVVFLLALVALSVVIRLVGDIPHLRDGTIPSEEFDRRYVAHPWIGYLHLGAGVVFLLGAPLQLSRRFRTRHYPVHRRMGRILLTCALVSAVFALVFGIRFAWGGATETTATVVFGSWFITCLVLAFRAIKSDNVPQHRRWMIRAFAVAVGIGTIRVWLVIFEAIGTPTVSPDPTMFGVAFWLGFSMHVAFGEWWLRRTPALNG